MRCDVDIIEIIKSIFFGIVEGITEWLPVSSTGHMILLDEFIKLDVSTIFLEMYLVVIQLGAIMAVVVLYWNKLFPFSIKEKNFIKSDSFKMWLKIIVACIPAAIVGLLFEDQIDRYFYNYQTVAIALITFGVFFIVIEKKHENSKPQVTHINDITYKTAFYIGLFQLIAAVFPGTSRSGATIVGGLMLSMSRTVAAEFTFFLAVPVMFGASLLKMFKFGFDFTSSELVILFTGLITAFIVSIISIQFLIRYIKKHDFKVFGWYRIVLGIIVIGYFVIYG